MGGSPPGSSVQGFSKQESWSGWPCPSPGDLPNPGMEPRPLTSALAGGFFTTGTTWNKIDPLEHRRLHLSLSLSKGTWGSSLSRHHKTWPQLWFLLDFHILALLRRLCNNKTYAQAFLKTHAGSFKTLKSEFIFIEIIFLKREIYIVLLMEKIALS